MEDQSAARKQAGELAKLQDFFPPGARDVTASPLGRASRNQGQVTPPPRPQTPDRKPCVLESPTHDKSG